MRRMGILLLVCAPVVFLLTAPGCSKKPAETKPDPAPLDIAGLKADEAKRNKGPAGGKNETQLMQTWKVIDGDMPAGAILKFNLDRTVDLKITTKGKEKSEKGTYKLADDATVLLKLPPENEEKKLKIKEVGYRYLQLEDEKGKTTKFERIVQNADD